MAGETLQTNPVATMVVSVEVWRKLHTYVQLCPIEISGFGTISQVGALTFRLEDVFIFEQEASDVHVTVSNEVMHRQLYQLDQAGLKVSTIRFQWHSHVTMAAYMSGTDEANINNYPGDWMLSLVTNKFGDYEARLDVLRPLRVTIPVTAVIEIDPIEELSYQLKAEIALKVKGSKRGPFGLYSRQISVSKVRSVLVEQCVLAPETED